MKSELKEKNSISVLGDGERLSNFIHINRLIEIIKIFIFKDVEGVFNIGDETLSYLDLAKKIIREQGNNASVIEKKIEGSRAKFILDTQKINKLMNLKN